ncbi:hypothetical protein AKJ18_15145 [Vibrio xuii]|nr:hypothetical protein AKJ18_15145 [Vibrio xuii]
MISVPLNSFVHRVADKAQVIQVMSEQDCQIKRIRRSRNWLLSGEEEALRQLKSQLTTEDTQWIVTAIDKTLPTPVVDLAVLIANSPNITINQLVAQSGCTISEARLAIDEFEDL